MENWTPNDADPGSQSVPLPITPRETIYHVFCLFYDSVLRLRNAHIMVDVGCGCKDALEACR